jgi:ligand-binding sensor domain-containing protein
MNRTSHIAGWAWLAIGCALFNRIAAGSHGASKQAPIIEVITSTRRVTCLAASPDGGLWAGTGGGILWRQPDGKWRKFTREDGLPSHEVRTIRVEGSLVRASFPTADVEWDGNSWKQVSATLANNVTEADWGGSHYVTERGRFGKRDAKGTKEIPLPASPGSHVSALLTREKHLVAGIYGDGLWAFNGKNWDRLDVGLPEEAREITALSECGGSLWVGTRRAGLWQQSGKEWKQHVLSDEPINHNVQSLALFQGKLMMGTLEDGLLVHTGNCWSGVASGDTSSASPRQMAEMSSLLYVRHGNGKLDCWNGSTWERDLCAGLARKEVAAIATDGKQLFAAQWGGWSEFDGKHWTSHLDLKQLQGVPTTSLCVEANTVWLGTQGKGIAEISRISGNLRWHDARNGLKDYWITAMAVTDGTLYAGTFVGGLTRREGDRWITLLDGENVTAIESDRTGRVLAGTRRGLWRVSGETVSKVEVGDTEIQALLRTEKGLWVGARTGIYFVKTDGVRDQASRER